MRTLCWLVTGSAVALLFAPLSCSRDARDPGRPTAATSDPTYDVTPVVGESWLNHLGLLPSQTHMGQMGGTAEPTASAREEPNIVGSHDRGESFRGGMRGMMGRFYSLLRTDRSQADAVMREEFHVAGADLYRLDCQSCHGPGGEGAPPEIKSLLEPVRGASRALVKERMARLGRPISDAMADQIAGQAEESILKRLAHGGEKMPPFKHLRGDEIDALLGYLGQLAGVPSTSRTGMTVPESAARVGEHLVKGTCHICHNATGPGGGNMAMMQGITPSLASMPQQLSLSSVLRQVQYGSPPMMAMMGGQEMPALPYLTGDEVAAAYFYLVAYPPRP